MGNQYAFLVECPGLFQDNSRKKVVLATSIQKALKLVEDLIDEAKMPWVRIESIVCIGEVLNG